MLSRTLTYIHARKFSLLIASMSMVRTSSLARSLVVVVVVACSSLKFAIKSEGKKRLQGVKKIYEMIKCGVERGSID